MLSLLFSKITPSKTVYFCFEERLANSRFAKSFFQGIAKPFLVLRTQMSASSQLVQINKETSMLAANPAVEITRLTTMLGLGSRTFAILSIILIAIASLSIFSGLAANLENRLGDLAILRALGYSKNRIFKIICFEGMILTVLGIFFGILIGMIVFNFFIQAINSLNISQASFRLIPSFFLIITCVFFAGFFAAIFPAYRASKISVANQLSKNI